MRFQSKNNTLTPTTKVISNPLLKNINQGDIKNYDDESINKIKIGNSFINDNQVKNNYNKSSSSPLNNLLKYSDLKFDHFIDAKDFEKDIDKTQQQSNDKQSLNNDKSTKFKFPLGFIFSKSNKDEKEIEDRICDTNTTKRKDSLSNILN